MKILRLFTIVVILLLIRISIDLVFAGGKQYGFINGANVNMRSAPEKNSIVIRQFMNNEFVIYEGRSKDKIRIDNYEDYWYKIKTTDNKQGWVFGKYFYYLDENKIPEKYYKYIIENYILLTITSIPSANDHSAYDFTIVFDIDFNYLKDKGYVIFKYKDLNTNTHFIMGSATLFYKIENNIPRLVIYAALNGDKGYYFDGKYIFTIGRLGVSVYDTTREGENYSAAMKDRKSVV